MKKILFCVTVSFILFLTWVFCVATIDAGETGVVTLFGKVQNGVLSPGVHILNPFSYVNKINLRILTTTANSEAASRDLQTVHTSITVNFNIKLKDIKQFYIDFGNDPNNIETNIIAPAISEAFKSQVALFTAEELIEKRNIVSQGIFSALIHRLEHYNINIDSINITDFKFSKEFDNAIESKVTAQQNAFKAQNDLERIKIEAEQKIVQATANAKAMDLQRQSVTEELIQLKKLDNEREAISKWDGVLPKMVSGSSIPFIVDIK